MTSLYIPKALRERVSRQARYQCGYCLSQALVQGMDMDFDHLIPLSLGSLTEEANLWLACAFCNNTKNKRVSALDPMDGKLVSLFNPRYQVWSDHFSWNDTQDRILGISSTGRATVVALKLNREVLVKARKLWVALGKHPPPD